MHENDCWHLSLVLVLSCPSQPNTEASYNFSVSWVCRIQLMWVITQRGVGLVRAAVIQHSIRFTAHRVIWEHGTVHWEFALCAPSFCSYALRIYSTNSVYVVCYQVHTFKNMQRCSLTFTIWLNFPSLVSESMWYEALIRLVFPVPYWSDQRLSFHF